MTTRPHVEDAYVLSVADVLVAHAEGKSSVMAKRPSLPWSPGGSQEVGFKLRLGEFRGVVDLRYTTGTIGYEGPVVHTIALEITRPNYGGLRWWFRCGVTGRRASKLYLFPGERLFCHRTGVAPNPTYLSQRVSGADKVYRRLHALRQKNSGQGSIFDSPKRTRGMHLKTYVKLLKRDAEIWRSSDNKLLGWLRSHGF